MNEPTGYTALDLIGYTDRGDYSAVATYVKNDLTNYGGTKWRCLVDDTTGVTPTEGVNWTVFVAIPADTTKQIIAPVESATSLHAYEVGEQLIYNDTLYKVIAPIAVNDALVVDTNIEVSPKTVIEQVEDLDANKMSYAANTKLGAHNRIPVSSIFASGTVSGLTYTVNSNDTVKINGTITTGQTFAHKDCSATFTLPAGTYSFADGLADGTSASCGIVLRKTNSSGDVLVNTTNTAHNGTFSISSDTVVWARIYADSSFGTFSNVMLYPLLKVIEDTDSTFASFTMTNRELTNTLKSLFLPTYIANGVTYTGNCNDLEPGLVYVGSGATNSPGNYYLVFTFSVDLHEGKITGYGTQIAIGITTHNIKTRICNTGTWSAWKTITPT